MQCVGARVRVQDIKHNTAVFNAPEIKYKLLGAIHIACFWHCKHTDVYFSQPQTKIKDQDWSSKSKDAIFSS